MAAGSKGGDCLMPTPKETVSRVASKLRRGDKIVGGSVKNNRQIIRITSIEKNGDFYFIKFSDGDWTSCAGTAKFQVVTR